MDQLGLRARQGLLLAAVALGLAGCGDDDVMIGGDDAGGGRDSGGGRDGGTPGEDSGTPGEDAGTPGDGGSTDAPATDGGGGEECGPVTCEVGQVCCNASCGICTAPGEGCIALACEDAGPGPVVCGGFAGMPCAADEYCEYPPEAMCGRADGTGVCRERPTICPELYAPVCGCDGMTYGNSCEAAAAGVTAERRGECESGGGLCDPQDARGVGPCDAFFGYFWNGSDCLGASGCECVGTACSMGWMDRDECIAAHAVCLPTATDCSGVTCDGTQVCDYPDDGCGTGEAGACAPRPDLCAGIFAPVCGCDGMTYSNACTAHSRGVDVDYEGECTSEPPPPPMDCRTTGCGPDAECQFCFRLWQCVPRGAMC